MKKYFLTLIILFICSVGFSQDFQTNNINSNLSTLQYITPNVGFGVVYRNNYTQLAKTTNKGINWQYLNITNTSTTAEINFINESTGYALYDDVIAKTTNAGNNWSTSTYSFLQNNDNESLIKFRDAYLGYIVYRSSSTSEGLKIYKTSDGGDNWSLVYNPAASSNVYYIKDIAFDISNPNIVAFAGYSLGTLSNYVILSTLDGCSNVTKTEGPFTSGLNSASNSVTIIRNTANNEAEITGLITKQNGSSSDGIYMGKIKVNNMSYAEFKIDGFISGANYLTGNGIKFGSLLNGKCLAQGKLYSTSNGGANWSQMYDFQSVDNSSKQKLNTFGFGAVYLGNSNGTVAGRRTQNAALFHLDVSSEYAYGNIFLQDDPAISTYNTYSTSNFLYLLGGDVKGKAQDILNPNQSNEALFYTWDHNRTNIENHFYFTHEGQYRMDLFYKSKNISVENTAIQYSSQTKTLKDANGIINRIHSSIGGIFYSRSSNNGATFQREEIVNAGTQFTQDFPEATVGSGNKNPSITEIRNSNAAYNGAPVSSGYPLNNIASVWESYNGTSGKTEIKTAIRYDNNAGSKDWYKYQRRVGSTDVRDGVITDFTSSSTFESKPVIFCSVEPSYMNDPYNYTYVVLHLEPNGANTNLVATVSYGHPSIGRAYTTNYTIASGNITDFAAVSSQLSYPGLFTIHLTYKKDNGIYYKKSQIGIDVSPGTLGFGPSNNPQVVYPNSLGLDQFTYPLHQGDGAITFRYTPDISLRNGKPVITYQGKYTIARAYTIDGATGLGNATVVNLNYYPIVVKYATGNTTWSNFIMYNSDGVSSQQNPNIEGCTGGNAYVLNFSKSNSMFKHFVKGDNLGGYYCEPSTFSGPDTKLVEGSYNSPTGDALRTTLTSQQGPAQMKYLLANSNISITNNNSQSQDNAYGNIKGVINLNSTDYVFNLGPIIIQSGQQEIEEIEMNEEPPLLTTGVEFNEYMASSPFTLHTGDTLILGTSGFYKENKSVTFEPIVYRVNLINASTNEIDRELFNDTINVEDENITEYYRGYVMGEIEGDLSCYVQIHVEGLEGKDAIYTLSGVYDGDEPTEGDNLAAGRIFVDFGNSGGTSSNVNIKPTTFSLAQNFPNPFNPTTTIRYSLPNDGLVQIKIYDLSGKEVMNLVNENKTAGNYEVKFNGANLSSGVYFYRINAGEFVQTKRMVLIK